MAQSCKLDTLAYWVPLEVEHGVYGLNFYPPVTLFQSVADDTAIVAITNDELIAVFNVGVLERNFGGRTLKHIIGRVAPP